eukprot:Gb_34054 [translate_table: standard]
MLLRSRNFMGLPVLIILIICLCLSTVTCHQGCQKHEKEALLAFKTSFEDASGSLNSWKGDDCCEWRGIGCDKGIRSVIKLDIRGMHLRPLRKVLDSSLFSLKNLEYVNLSFNNFSGVGIPSELGLLQRLRYLDLSHSGFCGIIPWQLGNLSKLEYLSFSRDILLDLTSLLWVSDLSWIKNLSALEYLSVNGVDLRRVADNWDHWIASLSKLRHLHMAGCRLLGAIPQSLVRITRLSDLDLSFNTFSAGSMPPWLSSMTSLVSLNLSGCGLRGPNSELSPTLQELVLDRNYNLSINVSVFVNGHWPLLRRLSLSACNLEGVITSAISRLLYLEYLDLSSNQIEGAIPDCMGKLYNLQFLDLSFNNLGGRIPTSLGLLSNVSHLDLRHNQLNGTIPRSLSKLSLLDYLGLGHNGLTGSIPAEFGLLSKLSTLDISFNNLSHSVSDTMFQRLNRLKYLHLSNSGLTVNMRNSAWRNSPPFSLEQLYLTSCNMQGEVPQWLSTQEKLVFLDLSDNGLSGSIPNWLWKLPNLAQVNLSNNNLEGMLPTSVRLNPHAGPRIVDLHSNHLQGPLPLSFGPVEVLDLSNNKFRGSIPSEIFGDHWSINFLSLSNNSLSGHIPRSLSGSCFLEVLDLSNNILSGKLHHLFTKCSSLVVLNLANNALEGELPHELGKMRKLQTLHMNNNRLTGTLPPSMQNCTALEILELGKNKFSGNIPSWIQHLSRLRIVVLNANNFQGTIPKEISKLNSIQILDLSVNNLTGPIPANLAAFRGMTAQQPAGSFILRYVIGLGMTMSLYRTDAEGGLGLFYGADVEVMSKGQQMHFEQIPSIVTCMDLSSNNLVGHIPSEIGDLTALVTLNISRNNLSGNIPATVGNMKQLESLDISWNQISGEIPTQLVTIDFLQYLNLCNNRLSGMIPQNPHFNTFDANSFSGNPDLCGFPLKKSCWNDHGRPSETSPPGEEEEEEDSDEIDLWWAIGVGLSYGVGFSVVITSLVVNKRWRSKHFEFMDMAVILLVRWLWRCVRSCARRSFEPWTFVVNLSCAAAYNSTQNSIGWICWTLGLSCVPILADLSEKGARISEGIFYPLKCASKQLFIF